MLSTNCRNDQAIEHRTISQADGLLFTCQAELELARQPFRPYHPARETSVGLGIDEPPARKPSMHTAFQAACPGLRDRKYLLFLSRIHPKKGADILLSAYAKVTNEHSMGAPPPALVVAGPLNSTFANEIQRLAVALGCAVTPKQQCSSMRPAVFFPGMLSGDAKWGAFYNCDAFVLPSHQENFGIAVVEALACGKPVLISDQVNIFGEIKRSNAGLVAADTLAGTCELIGSWLEKTDGQKSQMSRNAVTCFKRHFRAESVAGELLATVSEGLELSTQDNLSSTQRLPIRLPIGSHEQYGKLRGVSCSDHRLESFFVGGD